MQWAIMLNIQIPLYKHIPFYITHAPEVSYGLYYDNLAPCWFTLGSEIDNYHSYYRNYKAEDGDLDYYVILGPKILDVTKNIVALREVLFLVQNGA